MGLKGAWSPHNIWKKNYYIYIEREKERELYIYIYKERKRERGRDNRVILIKKNDIFIIFLQQFLNEKLLLVVMDAQKSYLSCCLKLELITTYHLRFIVKLL